MLSRCLFNLYAKYIMQNAKVNESQAGIKISERNTNNLRYADDTTLMAESRGTKEPLDEGERGEWKSWLKTQYSKNENHGIWFHSVQFSPVTQSCPTLCDPIDGSPPGSAIPGILQARTLEWGAVSFSNAWEWKVKMKSLSHVWLFATPWTAAYHAPLSMGFSRQEYWSGVPLPSPFRDFSTI